MGRLPFSAYDFFSYLSAGIVVIAGVDFAFRAAAALDDTPPLPLTVLAVLGAYVVGHIVAQLAGLLLERGAAALTRPPEETLLADAPADTSESSSDLYRPLDPPTRDRVLERARAAGFPLPTGTAPGALGSKALWKHCFVRVRGDAPTAARMSTFSYLADFSRNVAGAAAIAAVAIAGGIATGRAGPGAGWWLAATLIAAAGLGLRYLRFRRLFHAEAYIAYAELDAGVALKANIAPSPPTVTGAAP